MIRTATPDETGAVQEGLDAIHEGLADAILAGDLLLIVDRDGVQAVTAMAPAMLGLDEALWQDADHAGLRLGTLEDGAFQLDLQGAVLAASQTKRQTVRVIERAARLWVYGRDIIGESVLWGDPTLKRGAICILCNPRGEGLGLGKVVARLKGPRTVVENILDLGTYLRDQ